RGSRVCRQCASRTGCEAQSALLLNDRERIRTQFRLNARRLQRSSKIFCGASSRSLGSGFVGLVLLFSSRLFVGRPRKVLAFAPRKTSGSERCLAKRILSQHCVTERSARRGYVRASATTQRSSKELPPKTPLRAAIF